MKLKDLLLEAMVPHNNTELGKILISNDNFKFNRKTGGYMLAEDKKEERIYGWRLYRQRGTWTMAYIYQDVSENNWGDPVYTGQLHLTGEKANFDRVMAKFKENLEGLFNVSSKVISKIQVV